MEVYCGQKSIYCNRTDFQNCYRVFVLDLFSLSSCCNEVFAIEFLQIEFCELSFLQLNFCNQVFTIKFLQSNFCKLIFFAIKFCKLIFLQSSFCKLSFCNWVFAIELLHLSFFNQVFAVDFASSSSTWASPTVRKCNHINLVFHACNMAINYT